MPHQPLYESLTRIDKIFKNTDSSANFSLKAVNGEIHRRIIYHGSNHNRLLLTKEIDNLEGWMKTIPIVSDCSGSWSIVGAKTMTEKVLKSAATEYRCRLYNLDISRPASHRLKTAYEMISGAADRLAEVQMNANATEFDTYDWQIICKGRETRKIRARSAREAAWTYAALYVRDRKEVANWRDTIKDIRLVARIYPPQEWHDATS